MTAAVSSFISRTSKNAAEWVSRCCLLMVLCSGGHLLFAQAAAANFGPVDIGTTSAAVPLVLTFQTSGTLASTAVLTQGAAGLDFADAGSGTCPVNTAYTAGQTCTVNVSFTPRFAGTRIGSVVLTDNLGNTMATGYVLGMGIGPQIVFQPAAQSQLGSGINPPASVAVDGNGDLFVTGLGGSGSAMLYEMVAVNGEVPASPTIKTIGSGFGSLIFVAIDPGGNLYISDSSKNAVKEVLAVNGAVPASPAILTLSSGFNEPAGIATDANGNVYVADFGNSEIKEIETVNGRLPATPTIKVLGSGFKNPIGVAVDAAGNVFVADSSNNVVKEIAAGNGQTSILASGFNTPYDVAVDWDGNVYVADYNNNAVKEIEAVNGSIPPSPAIQTLAGGFRSPGGVAVDADGNVYVADTGNGQLRGLQNGNGIGCPASQSGRAELHSQRLLGLSGTQPGQERH
jgi:sugar lactone lactonase YvrE